MYGLMIESGAPPQQTAKHVGDERHPRVRARTRAPVNSCRSASAVRPFEPLHQHGNGQVRLGSDEQVHVVGVPTELDQLDGECSADGAHGALTDCEHCTGGKRRRHMVTNTKWASSTYMLCRDWW
jgi:hypothetical protein